jgi:Spy/CpxP family protein refolding chaperone
MDAVMVELTEQLELTDEQAGEIRELLETQRVRSRELLEAARASGEGRSGMAGMREKMAEIREATSAAVNRILSAEQAALYEELQAEQRERRRGGPGGP